MLNRSLIKRFNETVNDHWFAFFKYRAYNDKNLWNCICSAMDWISVSVEHINHFLNDSKSNLSSIEIYALVASVDIIVEAVQQLHRVLISPSDVLYKNDREVFVSNIFGQNDLDYFKTLRSCFGAHPINLRDDVAKDKKEAIEKRRFASWSYAHKGSGIATVILYSNQIDGKDIVLNMEFDQVIAFGEKYYNYLEELIKALNHQRKDWFEAKRKEVIPQPSDPIEHLEILRSELQTRIENGCYNSDIEELLLLFRTSVTSEKNILLVKKYRKALTKLVDNIHVHIQNMDFSDCEGMELLMPQPQCLKAGWGYWYQKLYSGVLGGGYGAFYWEDAILEIFSPYFEPEYNSYEELYLLVNAALFALASREDN